MAIKREAKKIVGYGARLTERLAAAGITQIELANAAGLSRQTISRLIARDEASSRTINLIEEVLVARGSAVGSTGAISRGGRASRSWATASDLVDWSSRREAQETLPQIVRRLILATAESARFVSFAAGDGIGQPGWDGQVSALRGNAFVPEGDSVWELGTGGDPGQKAQDDYRKRLKRAGAKDLSNTTFIFVTSRRWPEKHEWTEKKRNDKRWNDVRVIDADDLETWLETSPSVHVWLSGRLGTFPDGAQDMESWWDTWLGATHPSLNAQFLSSGRDDQVKQIQDWYRAPKGPLAVQSESREQSVAVAASALLALPAPESDDALARSVIVTHAAAWRSMIAGRSRLILIPTFDVGDGVGAAIKAGHAVLLPNGEGDVEFDGAVKLPPVGRAKAIEALKAEGAQDDEARELAGIARRSMTALRRRLAVATLLQRPEWAKPLEARSLLPALLAGSWNDTNSKDRDALATLSRKPYDQLADDLARWTFGSDPALRRRGTLWYLSSREDAWDLLERYVSDDDVARFKSVAIDVLTTPDPRFELPSDERWLAHIHGKKAPYSGALIRSLTNTLAVIGVRDGKALDDASSSPLRYAASLVVREVLARANANWRVWASLSDVLGDLAEASPEDFLNSVESALRDKTAPISQLFTAESDAMFGSAPHTGLLWALERLAWSGDHLGRVASILAELARKDPGGKVSNRPAASLNSIFRSWLPQTCASVERRFKILDALAKRDEDSAWDVLLSLLPQLNSFAMPNARPHWRGWADDARDSVTRGEYAATIRGAVERLLALAKLSGPRWAALVEALPHLSVQEHTAVLDGLSSIDLTNLHESDRATIWNAVRRLVANHRGFPNAKWAMNEEYVARIDALRERFVPLDLIDKWKWLFSWHAELPESDAVRFEDPEAYECEKIAMRKKAVREIHESLGLDGILALAAAVDEAQFVGKAVADCGLCIDNEDQILRENLASTERYRADFATSFAFGRTVAEGAQWIPNKIEKLGNESTPRQRATLLLVVSDQSDAGKLAESLGPSIEREYWSMVWIVRRDNDLPLALRKLLHYGFVGRALENMGMHSSSVAVESALALEGLGRFLAGEGMDGPFSSSFAHYLGKLLDYLTNDPAVDQNKVARLEWGLLPMLPRYHRVPIALHRALADDPALFVEIVSIAFRAENEPPREMEISPLEQQQWERAFGLLESWRTIPGLSKERKVDQHKLAAWVAETREGLEAAGRLVIGDQRIGHMLSGAPSDEDGTWPCEAVRDIIEDVASNELETGFAIGLYNSRGVVSRSLDAGGREERSLAEQYEGLALAVGDSAFRTAAMLRGIAASYRREAAQEDERFAIDEDLGQ